jgi:hypothetical protein
MRVVQCFLVTTFVTSDACSRIAKTLDSEYLSALYESQQMLCNLLFSHKLLGVLEARPGALIVTFGGFL